MLWEDNYLAHWGIKGQKWGVRRFQNEDGTLTAAGKERYKVDPEQERKEKRALIDQAIKSSNNDLKYWNGMAKMHQRALDELKTDKRKGEWYDTDEEKRETIKITESDLRVAKSHAKEWEKSIKELKKIDPDTVSKKDLKKYVSKNSIINRLSNGDKGESLNYYQKKETMRQTKEAFDEAKKEERKLSYAFRKDKTEVSKMIAEKENAYRKAFFDYLHVSANSYQVSDRERKKASKKLQELQNKYYKNTIDNVKKTLGSDYELNYDGSGHVIGVSRKGETNVDMFFSMDPSLDAVYDSGGKLISKRKNK